MSDFTMETSFTQLLQELYDLPPSQRKQKLSGYWKTLSQDEQVSFSKELDSKLSSFEITADDYALFLRLSKSITWSLRTLTTFDDKQVLQTAISVVVMEWNKTPLNLKAAFEGDDVNGIVQLIHTQLPQYITSRLFSHIGSSSSLTDEHFHLVDGILKAIFPFIADGRATPIARYARPAIMSLFTAASPKILLSIIKRCAGWFDECTWSRLAKRRPEFMGDMLLHHIGVPREGAEWDFKIDSVSSGSSRYLFSTLPIIIRSGTPASAVLYDSFISHYPSFQSTLQDEKIEGPRIELATLTTIMAIIIRRERSHDAIIRSASVQFNIFKRIATACDEPKCTLESISPLLEIAVDQFSKAAGEWTLLSAQDARSQSGSQTATGILLLLLEQVKYTSTYLEDADRLILNSLNRLPRPARFPFLNLMHIAKSGMDLLHSPVLYPKITFAILKRIAADHIRIYLDTLQTSYSTHPRGTYYGADHHSIWTELFDADAVPACLHAFQVGSSRSTLRGFDLSQEDPRCRSDVEELKLKATRSRDANKRYTCVSAALALCMYSLSPGLFMEILSWATKRFAKDPVVSLGLYEMIIESSSGKYTSFLSHPGGIYVNQHTRKIFDAEFLSRWCLKTNEVVGCMLELLKVWIKESNYKNSIASHYNTLGTFLYTLIKTRMEIINDIFPTFVEDPKHLRELLLNPLVDWWLQWERMKVVDYPEPLGFDAVNCTPCIVESFIRHSMHLRILPTVLPFLEVMGEMRESLYREGRTRFSKDMDDAAVDKRKNELEYTSSRHFLPFTFKLLGDRRKHDAALDLRGPLGSYINSVLLDIDSKMQDHGDPYDWHPTQFDQALNTYLQFSKDRQHLASKIRWLLQTYTASENGRHPAMRLLQNSKVRICLWEDEELRRDMQSFLPEYPPPAAHQLDLDLGLPLHSSPKFNATIPQQLVKSRIPEVDGTYFVDILFEYGRSSWITRDASLKLVHRLMVFVPAWLFTVLDIPRSDDCKSDGPMGYALRYVRVKKEVLDRHTSSYYTLPSLVSGLLSHLLPLIATSEIELLLNAVFSSPSAQKDWAVTVSILTAVRRLRMPNLHKKQSFEVVKDVEASSWHRQAVTDGMVTSFRPPRAVEYVYQLLSFGQERRAEQFSSEHSAPTIKVSTLKMFLQLLESLFRRGALDSSLVNDFEQAGLLKAPPIIVSYVVQVLTQIATTTMMISGNDERTSADVQTMLASYVKIAQRLDETKSVSDEFWAAARSGLGPMPEVAEERPVADALLTVKFPSGSLALTQLWATFVVEPILKGHVELRTRWLKTAVAREHGPADLEEAISASFDTSSQFLSAYGSYAPHLNWQSDGHGETLLQIISRSILGPYHSEPFFKLQRLLDTNYPEGWATNPYGKSLASLIRYAIGDAKATQSLLSLLRVVKREDLPTDSAEEHLSCLLRIGSTMLSPENIILSIKAPNRRSFLTVEDIIDDVMDSVDSSTDRLLNHLLEVAEKYEQPLSAKMHNGGARYWKTILSLKIVLLNRSIKRSSSTLVTVEEEYAQGIAGIVNHVLDRRWYLADFPRDYKKYLGTISTAKTEVGNFVKACYRLSQPPLAAESGTIENAVFVETAMTILRELDGKIRYDVPGRMVRSDILNKWQNDNDGGLCWFALSWKESNR